MATDRLKEKEMNRPVSGALLGGGGLCVHQLRHLHLPVPHVLVF